MVGVPLVAIITALALSVQAEEPKKPVQKPGRPGVQAIHPGPAHPNLHPTQGPGHGPQGARIAHGALPSHNFGGHVYHGRLAWGRGRWHHEVRNGRDGWWWDVGGVWYFYPQPIEGPPAYVSDIEVMDEAAPDGPEGPPVTGYYPPPPPPPPPPGPDAIGGAIGGGIIGGILGGALTGRAGGAAVGAIVGGATGAAIGAQAEQRNGYYWWQGACYYRYPSGEYAAIDPRNCN
jgi:hypothetical protein